MTLKMIVSLAYLAVVFAHLSSWIIYIAVLYLPVPKGQMMRRLYYRGYLFFYLSGMAMNLMNFVLADSEIAMFFTLFLCAAHSFMYLRMSESPYLKERYGIGSES